MGENADTANMTRIMPGYDQEVRIRETTLPVFKAATLELISDSKTDEGREISFHLQSPAAAEYINLLFSDDAGISAVTVNGLPVKLPDMQAKDDSVMEKADAMKMKDKTRAEAWWRWRWYGLPREGADVKLTLEAGRPLTIKIIEVDYELPDSAPQRPANSMRKQYTWSDSTVIFQTLTFD